jgi:putative CocE/NonD family hydrolase
MRTNARWIVLAGIVLATTFSWSAEQFAVTIQSGVEAKMRDGTILRADIFRPTAEGSFPVLLERTPYNKTDEASFAAKAAARGYIVVLQDVRGRYTSDGEWYPFKNEINDGYDTVEWAAALPGSNGKVGMFGGSYVGATQMLAAIAHPPHLAGICPMVTASNYHEGWTYQGGAFEQWFNQSWTSILAQDTLRRAAVKGTNALNGIWQLPVSSYPLFDLPKAVQPSDLNSILAPYYLDWLAHPADDDYWKGLAIDEHFQDIQVPQLTVAAWYDIFLAGSLRNYLGVKQHGGSDAARQGQWLMVTIGGHAGDGRKVGDLDFGPDAAFDGDAVTLDWYDHLFLSKTNEFAGNKRVKMFVLGANQWREEDDWPLARARDTKYYLHSDGTANSVRGSGKLTVSTPNTEPADRYTYDPANPVPTTGGPLCCDRMRLVPGPRDQRSVESRDDVLVYSTAPMAHDTEVTGPVKLELFAKSSSVDTDFTAKLVDVWPDGYAQNLTEGIIRTRYRNSPEKAEWMNPGQVYHFTVDLWATSNVFKKGHMLRLEVSSSNFPRFDRNMNTGEDQGKATKYDSATNSIYHDAEHPSALILPIVP